MLIIVIGVVKNIKILIMIRIILVVFCFLFLFGFGICGVKLLIGLVVVWMEMIVIDGFFL